MPLPYNGVIEPEELARLLKDNDQVRLLDATYVMLGGPVTAEQLFERRHIKGAVCFNIDSIADPDSALPHMLPAPGDFAEAVSRLGIGNEDTVVVYDQSGVAMAAARVWWMFRVFGHDRVCVLNGGLPYWLATGYPVESGLAVPAAHSTFKAKFRPELVANIEEVKAASSNPEYLVLDARSAERFSGSVTEPRNGLRAGHIPGSSNLPFFDLLEPADGRLKAPENLGVLLAPFADKPQIISTCGSGVTACVLALAYHQLGKQDIAVYDGSWVEWGQEQAGTPIATGA